MNRYNNIRRMSEEDIKRSQRAVGALRSTLVMCQEHINSMMQVLSDCALSYKDSGERLATSLSTEELKRPYRFTAMHDFIAQSRALLNTARADCLERSHRLLAELQAKKKLIDEGFDQCGRTIKNVSEQLDTVSELYHGTYQDCVKSLETTRSEIQSAEVKRLADSTDPFLRYVTSVQKRNNKQVKRLKAREAETRTKLNGVIRDVNNHIDEINKAQAGLNDIYSRALGGMLQAWKSVVDCVLAQNTSQTLSSVRPLAETLERLLKMTPAELLAEFRACVTKSNPALGTCCFRIRG